MKKLTTTVTYRVPNWCYCNLEHGGAILEEKCRFCVPVKRGKQTVHVCVLHNEPLNISEGFVVYKCSDCTKKAEVVEEASREPIAAAPMVPPKDLIKWSIDKYQKSLAKALNEGYPMEVAQKYAKQAVLDS